MKSPNQNNERVAVILAGGQGSRFGGDKLTHRFKDGTPLDLLIGTLKSTHREIVIAGHGKYREFGFPVLTDLNPFEGPLSALGGVFDRLPAQKILVVAGDMPLITRSVIDLLWDQSSHSPLTLLEDTRGVTPLPGIYSTSLSFVVKKCLKAGRRDLFCLSIASPSLKIVPRGALAAVDPEGLSFLNINTHGDLSSLSTL